MIDLFRQLKLDYKEYLLLFKSGYFYVAFDEDATILNRLFDYKIVKLKNNIKSGFPTNNLEKVLDEINKKKINYVIIDNKNISFKKKFKSNNFKKYTNNIFNIININTRIDNINNYIKQLKNEKLMIEIIEEIENLIRNKVL